MTTRKKLTIFLCVVAVCVITSAVVLNKLISSKVSTLLEEHLVQSKQETDYLFESNGSKIQAYVYENSFWDEFYKATLKKDTNWINENMTQSLQKSHYGAEFIWVVDKEMKDVYSASLRNSFEIKMLHSVPFDLKDSINSDWFLHKVVAINGEYIELFTAPTQLSIDVQRKTAPVGFLILGRKINDDLFAVLHKNNQQVTYSIAPENAQHADAISVSNATIEYYKTLSQYNNKPLFIKASVYQPEIKTYNNFVFVAFLFFINFTLACLLLFYFVFARYVINPLAHISESLQNKNPAIIQHLKTYRNEFGEVARLISAFFENNNKLEEEIVQRKKSEADLQKALQVKSDFMSNMSHEIRTPINGIIGISNLLSNEKLTAEQLEYTKTLKHSSNHLLSVVSDILDFSKLESDNFKLESRPFNLRECCDKVFQLFKLRADEKKLSFYFYPDSTTHSDRIVGDEHRLTQILNNLVSNAIKFTSNGMVELSYKTVESSQLYVSYEFTIKDSGIGIKETEMGEIFNSFSQANSTINRKYGGTGLGLTISKKLIEKFGGELNVQSAYKIGSSFSFKITFLKQQENSAEEVQPKEVIHNQNLSKMKILIAEDNQINVFVLNQFLKKWGANVAVVENGKMALEKLKEEHFDIVLMDYHMPVMNGLEATNEIRKSNDEDTRNTPVFALTADVTSGTKQMLLNNGFNQYVSKPFSPDALYELLFQYKKAI